MSEQHPRQGWQDGTRGLTAVTARERGRARMRLATLGAGAASLVAAGAIAWNLPGPGHVRTTPASTPSSSPAGSYTGDDGSRDDGGASSSQPATAPHPSSGTSHATSGGS